MTTLTMSDVNTRAMPKPTGPTHEALSVIYAALDAYADRVKADDNRRHWLKTQARVSYLAGASRAVAISQAKADDAAIHGVRS